MVYVFTLLNILNYLDRYLVAAVLPGLKGEFLLTHEQSGQLQSAFVIGYVIFAPIFGYLGDRINRPRLMAFGAVLWSLATICSGLSQSFEAFFLSRIMVGVGEASFVTTAPGYIKDRFLTIEKINRALALFFAAIPVGAALGYVLGASVAGQFGWRWAFYVGGIPGLLLGASFLLFREERRSEQRAHVSLLSGTVEILSVRTLRYAIAGYTFNSFALNGIATFIVPFGVSIGFAEAQIGQYFGLILVASGLMGTLAGGRLATWYAAQSEFPLQRMLNLIGILSLIAVPLLAVAFTVASQPLFLALCFLSELLVFAAVAPVNSILVLASPAHLVTLTQGVTVLALNLFGAFLSPIFVGRAADAAGLAIALQLTPIALGLSAAVWIAGGRLTRDGAIKSAHE